MNKLSNNELREINGGGHFVLGLLLAGGITFLIGVIDGYVRPLSCNQEVCDMIELNKNELMCVEGGIKITATLINSVAKGVNTILNLGRALGSSIRRIGSKKLCSV